MPSPAKKRATSSGIGAEAEPAQITWSRPSIALIGPSTASFAASYLAWSSGDVEWPTWSDSTYSVPTCMAPWIAAFLTASGSIASNPESPDWIFSHTRGTPKNCAGRTSPRTPSRSDGSATR